MDPIVIVVFAIVIFILVIIVYNQFISLSNQTKNAWSDIDVLLKRRHDLIPNLVEIVKQYSTHESDVFEKVTEDRTKAMGAASVSEKGESENMLASSLKSVFAVAENYPELKSSENYQQLSAELKSTEDDLAQARRFYNANVRDLDTKVEMFPYNIFAKVFGFQKSDFFQADEDARADINIKIQQYTKKPDPD